MAEKRLRGVAEWGLGRFSCSSAQNFAQCTKPNGMNISHISDIAQCYCQEWHHSSNDLTDARGSESNVYATDHASFVRFEMRIITIKVNPMTLIYKGKLASMHLLVS